MAVFPLRKWTGRLRIRWHYLCHFCKENNANGDYLWPIEAPECPVKPRVLPRKEPGQCWGPWLITSFKWHQNQGQAETLKVLTSMTYTRILMSNCVLMLMSNWLPVQLDSVQLWIFDFTVKPLATGIFLTNKSRRKVLDTSTELSGLAGILREDLTWTQSEPLTDNKK